MQGSRLARFLFLLAAVLCLVGASRVGDTTRALRTEYDLTVRDEGKAVPPEYILTSALLGGFRGAFITTLWMRAQNMKMDGQFWEMVQLYNIITKLQPNTASAWAFAAWDLAWNVSVEINDRNERTFWVFRGIQLLRDQGIRKNPRVPELYYELAWIYYFKIGGEMDDAYPQYRRHLADRVSAVMRGTPTAFALQRMAELPVTREDFLALESVRPVHELFLAHGQDLLQDAPLVLRPELFATQDLPEALRALGDDEAAQSVLYDAMAWAVGDRIRATFNMDPAKMHALMERYGPLDWRVPFCHSLYWSHEAERLYYEDDPEVDTMKYQRIVYMSLQELIRQGRLVRAPDGRVYYTPEPAFIDAVIVYMDEMIETYSQRTLQSGKTFSLKGVRAGYENFLRGNILEAWVQGRHEAARRYLQKYTEIRGRPEPEYTSVPAFVAGESEAWVAGLSVPKINRALFNYLVSAYWYYTLGDTGNYDNSLAMARHLHAYGLRRWPSEDPGWEEEPVTSGRIPAWPQLHRFVLMQIFSGAAPEFDRQHLMMLASRLHEENPQLLQEILEEIRRERTALEAAPAGPGS